MSKIKTVPLRFSVYREGDSPVFGESATHVCVDDDAGGAFIVLRQSYEPRGEQVLRFDLDELLAVTVAARGLMEEHKTSK